MDPRLNVRAHAPVWTSAAGRFLALFMAAFCAVLMTTCARNSSKEDGVPGGQDPQPSDPDKYKYSSQSLFYDAPLSAVEIANLSYTAPRASVGAPKDHYLWSIAGPNKDYVEMYSQWKWTHRGGDWLDSSGVSQGTAPCWTFSATAVTSGSYTYAVDMTAALRQCYANNTWNAWVIRSAQNRSWATRHSATPPSLSVVYTDGSSESLRCIATVGLYDGSAYAYVGKLSHVLWGNNGLIEFERPRKAIASATMTFTIDSHAAGAATVDGFLCAPPVNSGARSTGIAANYPLDVGIAANPAVRFAQSYVDGTTTSDYIALGNTTHNIGYMSEWSPHLFGAGAANTNKLPYSWNGTSLANKLIQGAVPATPPVVVPSTYSGEGFTPVAPGIGALKVVIPGNHAADGANVGSAGALGADLWAFLPEAECGLIDDLYVRYQVMYAPYPRQSVEQTKMFRSEAAASAVYMTPRGKTGFGPQHWTAFGGNNRAGGGNLGWSSRGIYTSPNDMDPDSIFMGWHALDMWYSNAPQGTQGGCVWAGQQGGIGTRFKRGQWYDVEVRLKLNTWTEDWMNSATHDGIYQMWIDGILAIDFQNFTFRQGPLNYTDPADVSAAVNRGHTPTNGTYHPPFRQLGHAGIWLNEYQGGVISCEFDQTVFYSNVVAATSRIGPMSH